MVCPSCKKYLPENKIVEVDKYNFKVKDDEIDFLSLIGYFLFQKRLILCEDCCITSRNKRKGEKNE